MVKQSGQTISPSTNQNTPDSRLTLAHVTHEAVEQLGGIGTVLEGMMISPVYQAAVKRSILVGTFQTHIASRAQDRLGEHGQVLYSSIDQIDTVGLAAKFRPVEWAFDVAIVYGKRTYNPPGEGRTGEAEVLLIDVFRTNPDRLAVFKLRLWERFKLDSAKYDGDWGYEEWVRLAEPAFYALSALLDEDDLPCVMFAHEFMGIPAALATILDGGDKFRTVFHAHECSTARQLVENHPGHDTFFYNVMRQAREQGQYVSDVFGDLDHYFRHALVRRTHLCDGIIAVGDYTRDELHFLGPQFDDTPINLVYNGIPAMAVDLKSKMASRDMLVTYSEKLLGYKPDVLMTHVTRPVISKGLWRDVRVCHEMDTRFQTTGQTGVLYILTSAGGTRHTRDVHHMEKNYNWPRHHRDGYPDLVGPEVELDGMCQAFNAEHQNIQIVLCNQFGWSSPRMGKRLPNDMNIADLRRAADVEFGMATYEPFGISPLEPLGSGAICVISNVCGCQGFVNHVTHSQGTPNVLVADYTKLDRPYTLQKLQQMGQHERDPIESAEAIRIADELIKRLPKSANEQQTLITQGQALVAKMGWDQVIEEGLLPMLKNVRDGNAL